MKNEKIEKLTEKIKNEMLEYVEKNKKHRNIHEYYLKAIEFLILELVKMHIKIKEK